jgi:hypothetical protein
MADFLIIDNGDVTGTPRLRAPVVGTRSPGPTKTSVIKIAETRGGEGRRDLWPAGIVKRSWICSKFASNPKIKSNLLISYCTISIEISFGWKNKLHSYACSIWKPSKSRSYFITNLTVDKIQNRNPGLLTNTLVTLLFRLRDLFQQCMQAMTEKRIHLIAFSTNTSQPVHETMLALNHP